MVGRDWRFYGESEGSDETCETFSTGRDDVHGGPTGPNWRLYGESDDSHESRDAFFTDGGETHGGQSAPNWRFFGERADGDPSDNRGFSEVFSDYDDPPCDQPFNPNDFRIHHEPLDDRLWPNAE